ncbi:IPT/TIG domain-containing protein [bacterium]|nr:IPT/TIG domain-containing protein [bacterium]
MRAAVLLLSLAFPLLAGCSCGDDDDDDGAAFDDDSALDDDQDDDDTSGDDDSDDDAAADDDDADDDNAIDDDDADDDDAIDDDAGDDDAIDDDAVDDDAVDDDTGDDDAVDDDTGDDDTTPAALAIDSVDPAAGGASVATLVTIEGDGFIAGIEVYVGTEAATNIVVVSATELHATFPPIELSRRGAKDVRVVRGADEATRAGGFEYLFDEDPVVMVHGLWGQGADFDKMKERFVALGYPADQLFAIDFTDDQASSRKNARYELPPFVDDVLAQTGAEKVDLISHSMGGLAARLYIKTYGGADKVRDYVSISGTQHGNNLSCPFIWLDDGPAELCPAYANQNQSENEVQWELNGDPDSADVDETPFGRDESGGLSYHALYTTADLIISPSTSGCLDQASRNDCTSPINQRVDGVGHIAMVYDAGVFDDVAAWVRAYNVSKP